MELAPTVIPQRRTPSIRLVAVAQIAWLLILSLPTLAVLGWSLRPRQGANVRLTAIHFTGGPIVLTAGCIIALAPTIWYLAVLVIVRARR